MNRVFKKTKSFLNMFIKTGSSFIHWLHWLTIQVFYNANEKFQHILGSVQQEKIGSFVISFLMAGIHQQ